MALMRVSGEGPLERLGLALNLGPGPVVEALFAPIQARVLHVAVRTGLLARLAAAPADAASLAAELQLAEAPTGLLLDCLAAQGHLARDGEAWTLSARSRPWLDPASPTSVLAYLDHTGDYWAWWARLEDVVRGGPHEDIHPEDPDDASWPRYVAGQHELARLSAPEVAAAVELGPDPRALLDVAGAHGWFSAALCRRHPALTATVIDLPGSARVGREVVAAAGLADRVRHEEGDLATTRLGGPYDGALVFNVLHHLDPRAIRALLARVHAALRPGGTLAVLDLLAREPGESPGGDALLGLFFHLTSGARTYGLGELSDWLAEAGFSVRSRAPIRRLPAQTLLQAQRV